MFKYLGIKRYRSELRRRTVMMMRKRRTSEVSCIAWGHGAVFLKLSSVGVLRVALVVASLCCTSVLAGCGGLLPNGDAPVESDPGSAGTGLNAIRMDDLPAEARTTLELIETGGPFPYDRDGTVFHNYERLLPERRDGYYREYTVVTPGSTDRGARRIVAGEQDERYYTDDHYRSFRLVVE